MEQLDIQLSGSQLQTVGVIDLGVIDIQFAARSVLTPGTQQRIDKDVQVLAHVVACFDHIATVAIDPSREMGLDGSSLLHDQRTMFEITDP